MAEPIPAAVEELPTDADALRELLAAHLLTLPVMPSPYDPHSPEGRAYYQARAEWSDRRRRIEHGIFKAETPKTVCKRQAPRPVPRAYPQAPTRFRP